MPDSASYRKPAQLHRTFTTVSNSRFVTTIGPAAITDDAREFLDRVRDEMPEATHHVYAFRVGYGNSVIEGMSDDGEPAGPPILAVLRGADIGDVIVVVSRYFGGTKLGTGGLVRAYTTAVQNGLGALKTEIKTAKKLVGIETPYPLYESIKRLITEHNGSIEEEDFTGVIAIFVLFPVDEIAEFSNALKNATAGQIQPIVLTDT